MSNVIKPLEFAGPVPLQPKLDMFGTAIQVGDAIVYGLGGVHGMAPFEIVNLTEKSIVAIRLDYDSRKSTLRFPGRAAVLPYSAVRAREMMATRYAEVTHGQKPPLKHEGTMIHQRDDDGRWTSKWVPVE